MRKTFQYLISLCAILFLTVVVAKGQLTFPQASASPTVAPTGAPVAAAPAAIPLAEVVTQAETAAASLRGIDGDLSSDQITAQVAGDLPSLAAEIDARTEESVRLLGANPSLDTLRGLESGWRKIGNNISDWKRNLTARATQLDREIANLVALDKTWKETLAAAQQTDTPLDVLQRIEAIIAQTQKTRETAEKSRAQILSLQNRVVAQEARVSAALAEVELARTAAVNRLFVKDSPALWSAELRSGTNQNLVQQSQNSFSSQLNALRAYAERQRFRFILHILLIAALVGALYWVRRKVQPWVEEEPSLKRASLVFALPLATAIVISILLSAWIYPQAPRLWRAILGAAALIPTIIILRRLVERHLLAILNALIIFYCFDLVRTVTASLVLVSRLVFLAEMFGGILFLLWLIRSHQMMAVPEAERGLAWRTMRVAARVALVVFAAAFLADVLGYVSLAYLLGNAVLGSAYIAIVLYAAVRIADGLSMFALRVRPLALLGMVREHRPLFRRRVRRVLQFLAFIWWLLLTLDLLSLRTLVIQYIRNILTATLSIGSLNISLGNILAFVITVWAAFLISRFVRFLLNEDVYPRVNLARGVPYAISTSLHYLILLVGFFAAVAAVGFDMTKFTILAGAFSVGLGFGLQNIFNNFVSGLIVLFERPVQVGDVIQMNDASGVVQRIGIRASVIRTPSGSEIIVPNGKLISDPVTNWTFSNSQRGIEIRVGVAYGTDPQLVIKLLKDVAESHPLVNKDPAPQALFVEFAADSLNFELRAWTNRSDAWVQIRSDLAVAINAALTEHDIQIPYTQRDLHLRSIDPQALQMLANNHVERTADRSATQDEHALETQNKA